MVRRAFVQLSLILLSIVSIGAVAQRKITFAQLVDAVQVITHLEALDIKSFSVPELRKLAFDEDAVWTARTQMLAELQFRRELVPTDWIKLLNNRQDDLFWGSCGELILRNPPTFNSAQRKSLSQSFEQIERKLRPVPYGIWLQVNSRVLRQSNKNVQSKRLTRLKDEVKRLSRQSG